MNYYNKFLELVALKMANDVEDEVTINNECKEALLKFIRARDPTSFCMIYLSTILIFKEYCEVHSVFEPDITTLENFMNSITVFRDGWDYVG